MGGFGVGMGEGKEGMRGGGEEVEDGAEGEG